MLRQLVGTRTGVIRDLSNARLELRARSSKASFDPIGGVGKRGLRFAREREGLALQRGRGRFNIWNHAPDFRTHCFHKSIDTLAGGGGCRTERTFGRPAEFHGPAFKIVRGARKLRPDTPELFAQLVGQHIDPILRCGGGDGQGHLRVAGQFVCAFGQRGGGSSGGRFDPIGLGNQSSVCGFQALGRRDCRVRNRLSRARGGVGRASTQAFRRFGNVRAVAFDLLTDEVQRRCDAFLDGSTGAEQSQLERRRQLTEAALQTLRRCG